MKRELTLCVGLALLVGCEQDVATYEDCVIEHVKDVNGAPAVNAIRRACKDKFPKETETVSIDEAFELDKEHKVTETEEGYKLVPVPYDPFKEGQPNENE